MEHPADSPLILDGRFHAERVREKVRACVKAFEQQQGRPPGLATVLVGDDAASKVYVRNKMRTARELGLASFEHNLGADCGQGEVLDLIASLNGDAAVDGVLVQLPLPKGLDQDAVIEAISPAKDVDGVHPLNAGRLSLGKPVFVPCTPLGCLYLIGVANKAIDGLNAVVAGRSVLVGKPVAQLLLNRNCTVTMAHSKTRDLPEVIARADIVVAAIGRPELIKGAWIKPGAIVIDVGINRISGADGKAQLTGDVDFAGASQRAGAITPVPGGVGPMTVAFLMANTAKAAFLASGLAWTDL